jgi:hypothetical protein
LLSKDSLLAAIKGEGYGYFPYSSEDAFELFRHETTRYIIFRVPTEFVKSVSAFAAHAYLRAYAQPAEDDLAYITVEDANETSLHHHLTYIDSTDSPESIRFKELALRDLKDFEYIARISGPDPCADLMIGKTPHFYASFYWFTTG